MGTQGAITTSAHATVCLISILITLMAKNHHKVLLQSQKEKEQQIHGQQVLQ